MYASGNIECISQLVRAYQIKHELEDLNTVKVLFFVGINFRGLHVRGFVNA